MIALGRVAGPSGVVPSAGSALRHRSITALPDAARPLPPGRASRGPLPCPACHRSPSALGPVSLPFRPGAASPSRDPRHSRPRGVRRGHARHAAWDIDFAAVVRAIPLIAAAGKPAGVASRSATSRPRRGFWMPAHRRVIAPMVNTSRMPAGSAPYEIPAARRAQLGAAHRHDAFRPQPDAYFAQANGFSISLAMVETREALGISTTSWRCRASTASSSAHRICRSRFRTALNDAAGAEVERALSHAVDRAKAAGKLIAVYVPTGERAAVMAGLGFNLIAVGSDTGFPRRRASGAERRPRLRGPAHRARRSGRVGHPKGLGLLKDRTPLRPGRAARRTVPGTARPGAAPRRRSHGRDRPTGAIGRGFRRRPASRSRKTGRRSESLRPGRHG